MIKKRALIMAGMAAGLMLAVCGPRTTAAETKIRIAVIRIQEVFKKYEGSKEREESMKKELKVQEEALAKTIKEIKQAEERLRNDRMLEKGSFEWFVRKQEIDKKKYYVETQRKKLLRQWDEKMVGLYKNIYAEMQEAIKRYAERNRYDLILRVMDEEIGSKAFAQIRREIRGKVVHYFNRRLDRTEQIIELMNRLYRARKKKTAKTDG